MYKPIFSLLLTLTLVFSLAITGLTAPQDGDMGQEQQAEPPIIRNIRAEFEAQFPGDEYNNFIEAVMGNNKVRLEA